MSLVEAVRSVLRQYARFSGRARRSEYWWWTLAHAVLLGVALAIDWAVNPDTLTGGYIAAVAVVAIGLALPYLAVSARRLHDRSMSAWWLLLFLLQIGPLVVMIFALFDGTPGPNKYGPDPKGRRTPHHPDELALSEAAS